MKPVRIIDEMVKMDAWFLNLCENYKDPWNNPHVVSKPNYLNDHNAVQRVIDGITDDRTLGSYDTLLVDITIRDAKKQGGWWSPIGAKMKATPAQKCEAILKATGKWED